MFPLCQGVRSLHQKLVNIALNDFFFYKADLNSKQLPMFLWAFYASRRTNAQVGPLDKMGCQYGLELLPFNQDSPDR
jgi:hypothetical protein